MKDIRVKLDDQLVETIKAEATATNDFVAVIARRIIENHYKKNKGGVFVKFTDAHLKGLSKGANKLGISMQDYLKILLDKTVPTDTMSTIIFSMPKNLDKKQSVDFLDAQFEKLKKKYMSE